MPIQVNQRFKDIWADVQIKVTRDVKNSTDYDIIYRGDRIGYILADKWPPLDKRRFMGMWLGCKTMAELMKKVPDNLLFNYYYLNTITIGRSYRGMGVGSVVLQKWLSTLTSPACVSLIPAKIDSVPTSVLVDFYEHNGFKIFNFDREQWGFAFVKSR